MNTSQPAALTLQQRKAKARARARGRRRKAWIISIITHGCILAVASVLLSALWNYTPKSPFIWKVRIVQADPLESPEQTPPPEEKPAPKKGVRDASPPRQPLAQVKRNSERKLRNLESRAARQGPIQTESIHPNMQHAAAAQSTKSHETPAPGQVFSMLGKVAPSSVQTRSLSNRSTAVVPQRHHAYPEVPRPQSEQTTGQKNRREGVRHPSQEHKDFSVNGKEVIAPEADTQVFQESSVRAQEHQQEEDFGWLTAALYKKIQTLKRYPRGARLQGMEGRVVVRTTIKNDGGLADMVVEEHSGYRLLDLDALETVRRAFPLNLEQEIRRSRVIILLPIIYTLKT